MINVFNKQQLLIMKNIKLFINKYNWKGINIHQK